MTRLLYAAAFFALLLAPLGTPPQMSSTPMMGMGPHGYDFLIGSWSCVNSMPSPTGGPPNATQNFSRGNAPGVLFARITGRGFDVSGYLFYDAKSKMWVTPTAYGNGDLSYETTTQMGKRVTFNGTYYSGGKSMPMRDTFALPTWRSYTDLTELRMGGAWKAVARVSCRKT